MADIVNADRLLVGLAYTLNQRVLPNIPDDSARFAAQKSIEMLVYLADRRIRSSGNDSAVDDKGAELRRILASGRVSADEIARLMLWMDADARSYLASRSSYRDALDAAQSAGSDIFPAATDEQVTQALRRWQGDPAIEGRVVGRAVGGYSKQTLFLEMLRNGIVERELVLRRDLPFAASDRSSVATEYPVLRALFEQGYPVAEPLMMEDDVSIMATPFLLSQRAAGRLYGNSLGLQDTASFDPDELLGTLLARLHRIDYRGMGLEILPDSAVDLAQQQARIDRWTAIYQAHAAEPFAVMEVGLAWLHANAHLVSDRCAIVHGDVGFHNILIKDDNVSALVDWELVHLANPVEDLAYASSYLQNPDALITHYVAHGGVSPTDGEMAYCRIFGDIRNTIYGTVSMTQFNSGDHNDVSILPIVLSSFQTYIPKLNRELREAITNHGFIWRES